MSPKTSKKSKYISRGKKKKEQTTHKPIPWPNLPPRITACLASQPDLMQKITSFGCVIKSWRSYPKQCNIFRLPHLVEIDQKDQTHSHVVEIPFHVEYLDFYYRRRSYSYRRCPGIYFRGYTHGQVVVMGADMSELYLWEPVWRSYWFLPKWDTSLPFKTCVVSSVNKYNAGVSAMAITGMCSPAFAFHRWERGMETEWSVHNCTVEEPYAPGQCMRFTNAIGHRGKFYALSSQGSVVTIEDTGSRFQVTAVGANRAVPSGLSRQFREYLVEVNGEILLVLLVSRKSINLVDDVEVFRLEFAGLLWVKVGSIGDTALVVEDECCMGVTARSIGCEKNCVYFSHHRDSVDVWWKFDMVSGHIEHASFCMHGDGSE